jgi:hypothetical protein
LLCAGKVAYLASCAQQTVAGENKPGYSAAAASKSSTGAKSKESVDSKESVRPPDTTPLAQLEKEIDETMSPARLQYPMSRGNTAASISNTGQARPITQGGPINYSSDAEIFLGRLPGLGKEKAIETIIQGMSEHVHNAQVQERACKVLFMLAESAENQVQIASAGGIESVRAAMAAHLKAARVQVLILLPAHKFLLYWYKSTNTDASPLGCRSRRAARSGTLL